MYLRPTYGDAGNVTGYRMSVDMEITVRDISKAGEVIDAAIGSGSNTLDAFSTPSAMRAICMARRWRPRIRGPPHGGKIGRRRWPDSGQDEISVTEYGSGVVVRENPETGGGANKARAMADTTVMAGTDTISAQVEVVFELQ